MQPVPVHELEMVSGGRNFTFVRTTTISAANFAVVNSSQTNVNVLGSGNHQGGGIAIGQVISIG